jgi:hypothetical protein
MGPFTTELNSMCQEASESSHVYCHAAVEVKNNRDRQPDLFRLFAFVADRLCRYLVKPCVDAIDSDVTTAD